MKNKTKSNNDYLAECHQIAQEHNGKLLSKVYINTHTKLEWECYKGHRWMAAPSKIKIGRWCPVCANKARGEKHRLTIEDTQKIAMQKNGICLSTEYVNSKTKLKWQCSVGHQWEAIYDSIRAGKWCPECGRQKTILVNTYSIKNAQKLAKEHGGKCRSNEYTNSSTKLIWECTEGHKWMANYNSIQQGSWCPECGRIKGGLARRNSIHDAQKLAKEKGGKCLSKIYYSTKNKLLWECSEGHQWKSAYSNIQSGHWCPECDKRKKGLARTVSIEDAHKLAEEHGGFCLSTIYKKSNAKLRWQCLDGHQWFATYESVKRGSWCLKCSGKEPLTLQEMQKIAEPQNGKCLSSEYINANTKLKWECAEGHQWEAKPSNIKAGHWCPKCSGNQLLSIENVKKLAKERGGKCRSKVYKGANFKLKWECSVGHVWEASYANIYSGKWCPECNSFRGERLCRIAFETIFSEAFPKSYPAWLKMDNNTQLELDGYSEKLHIAFEHQGQQHYRYNKRFHRSENDYKNQLKRDEIKKELCHKNGVILIVIPQIPDHLELENLVPYIITEAEKNHLTIQNKDNINPDYNQAYISSYTEYYDRLKEICSIKSGKVLSEQYTGRIDKMLFECELGHKWKTFPSSLFNGTWCPVCAKLNRASSKRLNIVHARELANSQGGKCLSENYKNNSEKLLWECKEGHQWRTKISHIKNGSWCPTCSAKKRGIKRRLNLEDAKRIAEEKGGKCLSKKYEVFPGKMLWECENGHQWLSTYTNIQSGRWCPECRRAHNE